MKKHFLLLMLVALLPLAGWAVDIKDVSIVVGSVTYGGSTAPTIKGSYNGVALENTEYQIDGYFKDANGSAKYDELSEIPAGSAYVKITGKDPYTGSRFEQFTVNPAPRYIKFAANNKTYGEADPAPLSTYTVYSDESCSTQITGDALTALGITIGRVTGEDAKTYAFTASTKDANYTMVNESKATGVFTINPLALTLGTNVQITKEQGDVVYTGKDIVGVYTIVATVNKKNVTLTAGVQAKSGDYYVASVKDVNASNKPTITFQGNYSGSITPENGFAVTPAPITVSVTDIKVPYENIDKADQSKTANLEFAGIVGDDITNASTLKTSFKSAITTKNDLSVKVAGEAINAGDYTLVISTGAQPTGNYEFKTFLPGKLTIEKKAITVTSNSVTKAVGEADPAFTYTNEALIGTDKLTGITCSRAEGEEAGAYVITPDVSAAKVMRQDKDGNYTVDVTANYAISAAKTSEQGKLTIGEGAIVITIKDAVKFYGQADPEFEYVVSGLLKEDEGKLGTITIKRAEDKDDPKTDVNENEEVTSYIITADAPANPNAERYSSVTVIPAILTIERAKLYVTIDAQNIKTSTAVKDLDTDVITAEGINNSDKITDLIDLAYNQDGDGALKYTDGAMNDNQTAAKGLKVTLKTAAADCYVLVDKDGEEISGTPQAVYGKLIVGNGSTKAINFTSVNDDYNTIVAQAGETQNVTLTIAPRNAREVPAGTKHTWKGGIWNAMVLPFEAKVRDISAALGYAIVNVVNPTATTEGNVAFKLEMGTIPANTPFMVKTDDDIKDDTKIQFTGVKIVAPADEYPSVEAGLGYKFVGAYKEMTINNETPDYHFMRGDVNKLAHIGATSANKWTIVPFDAYLDQSGASDAARLMDLTVTFEELDGTTTAIRAIDIDNESAGSKSLNGWYNLNGVQIDAPTQKGIYIHNGKKVVIK